MSREGRVREHVHHIEALTVQELGRLHQGPTFDQGQYMVAAARALRRALADALVRIEDLETKLAAPPEATTACDTCGGSGSVSLVPYALGVRVPVKCSHCRGTGRDS